MPVTFAFVYRSKKIEYFVFPSAVIEPLTLETKAKLDTSSVPNLSIPKVSYELLMCNEKENPHGLNSFHRDANTVFSRICGEKLHTQPKTGQVKQIC